jgi:phenylacetate-CoA ligase
LPVIRYRTGDVTRFVDGACACGRTHRRIARFSGRVDDMLVVRGVNVFPSEIEEVVFEHPAVGDQYAIVVDRRQALPRLEVRTELAGEGDAEPVAAELRERLEQRLHLRTLVSVVPHGTLPRQEVGKARRIYERLDDRDPLRP